MMTHANLNRGRNNTPGRKKYSKRELDLFKKFIELDKTSTIIFSIDSIEFSDNIDDHDSVYEISMRKLLKRTEYLNFNFSTIEESYLVVNNIPNDLLDTFKDWLVARAKELHYRNKRYELANKLVNDEQFEINK